MYDRSPLGDLFRSSQSASDKRADTATTGRSVAPDEANAGVAFCRRSLEVLAVAPGMAQGTDGRLLPARKRSAQGAADAWVHRLRRRHAAPDREYRRIAGLGARSGRAVL